MQSYILCHLLISGGNSELILIQRTLNNVDQKGILKALFQTCETELYLWNALLLRKTCLMHTLIVVPKDDFVAVEVCLYIYLFTFLMLPNSLVTLSYFTITSVQFYNLLTNTLLLLLIFIMFTVLFTLQTLIMLYINFYCLIFYNVLQKTKYQSENLF